MDANRFDTIAKDLVRSTSRRRALGVFLAGVLGLTSLLSHEQAEAKSCQKACEKKKDCQKKKDRKAKKKCKDQCKKSCKNQGGFCAGKNSCVDGRNFTTCQAGGAVACVCLVTASTGTPFCARSDVGFTVDCSATPCPSGETCVNLNGGPCDDPPNPGGLKCALACPDPIT
jgi:hypothetical protein